MQPPLDFLHMVTKVFSPLVGSQMQTGTENRTDQEFKILQPRSPVSQVSMATSDQKNDSNASKFSPCLHFSFLKKKRAFFISALL